MAGYSGTPLARKLGIKPGARVLRVDASPGLDEWLAPLPEGVQTSDGGSPSRAGSGPPLDVILFFTTEAKTLEAGFATLAARLKPAGGLWVCWPKKAAKVPTDLDEGRVRTLGLSAGLVDNKVCAVSEVWSGLRFVYRLKDRP